MTDHISRRGVIAAASLAAGALSAAASEPAAAQAPSSAPHLVQAQAITDNTGRKNQVIQGERLRRRAANQWALWPPCHG